MTQIAHTIQEQAWITRAACGDLGKLYEYCWWKTRYKMFVFTYIIFQNYEAKIQNIALSSLLNYGILTKTKRLIVTYDLYQKILPTIIKPNTIVFENFLLKNWE
jgi:hypothetical protein